MKKGLTTGNLGEVLNRYRQHQRFLPYLVLVLIILLTFSALTSGWDKINRLLEENRREKERVALLQQRVSQIESISTEEIDERIKNAVFALPRVKDPILILSSARQLALESNVMIEEISFSPGRINKEQSDGRSSARIEETTLSFSLLGSEENIRLLVERANKRSPLLSLSLLSLDFTQEEGVISAKITANTFTAPVDTDYFSEKAEITLSGKDEQIYQQVRALEKIGTSPIAEGAEFTIFDQNRDPFSPTNRDPSLP